MIQKMQIFVINARKATQPFLLAVPVCAFENGFEVLLSFLAELLFTSVQVTLHMQDLTKLILKKIKWMSEYKALKSILQCSW